MLEERIRHFDQMAKQLDDQDLIPENARKTISSENNADPDGTRNQKQRHPSDQAETSDAELPTHDEEGEAEVLLNRVSAATLQVPMFIHGTEVHAVVDTGAEVTVLSQQFFKKLKDTPALRKSRRKLVVAEAGRAMKSCGTADLEMKIGDLTFIWPVFVAPISDDVLLGCDVLYDKDILVSTRRGLKVNNQWVDCKIQKCESETARVTVSRSVTIPANCEFVMTGRCDKLEQDGTSTYVFEGTEEVKERILIARTVVTPTSNKIPIKMINSSMSPVKLKKGTFI